MHPISYGQAVLLGLLQGVTELFPISSLGHSVILPRLAGWDIRQQDEFFLTFLVATHLATALVLLLVFRRDWARIVAGLLRSVRDRRVPSEDTDARLGWMLVVGTIPAGVIGLALEHPLRRVFASPTAAAVFLFCNGLLLFAAERLRRRADLRQDDRDEADPDRRIVARTGWRRALGIGAAQAIALLPGFSRSGAAMGGGLLVGLSHQDAARFAFLLATPIIGAAAVLKLPDLAGAPGDGVRGPALVGAVCAASTAYLAVRFLLRYFETHSLAPFARYCTIAGAVCTVVLVAAG